MVEKTDKVLDAIKAATPPPEVGQPVLDGNNKTIVTPQEGGAAPNVPMAVVDIKNRENATTVAPQTVPANPAMVQWPTDRWGFTSDLRKMLLSIAGQIKGQKDKEDLVLMTLGIGAKHIIARRTADLEAQAHRKAWRDADDADRQRRLETYPGHVPKVAYEG